MVRVAKEVTEHYTATKIPIYVFPEKDLRGLGPNFHVHVRFIYSQDWSTDFLQENWQTDDGNI
jgi:hypothetical protein